MELFLATRADKDAPNEYGATPIYVASQTGHHEVVELLLAVGPTQTLRFLMGGRRWMLQNLSDTIL